MLNHWQNSKLEEIKAHVNLEIQLLEYRLEALNRLKYKHMKVTYTPTSLKEMFSDYQKYSQRAFNLMYYSLQLPKETLIKERIEREIIWLSMQADNVTDCIKDRMCEP